MWSKSILRKQEVQDWREKNLWMMAWKYEEPKHQQQSVKHSSKQSKINIWE